MAFHQWNSFKGNITVDHHDKNGDGLTQKFQAIIQVLAIIEDTE